MPCGSVQDGRTAAVRGSAAGRREDGGAVPGVRYLAQTGYKIFSRYKDCGLRTGLTVRGCGFESLSRTIGVGD